MKTKKEKIIAILLVVGLIVATGSISYAAFRFSGLGSKVNTITTGSVTMSYTESSNVLSMSGALPTTDATGKVRLNPGEYFDFTVSSSMSTSTNINYEIAVEELEGSTMSGDYIKFYLTKVDAEGNEEEVMAPSTYSAELNANTYTGRPANMMSLYTSSMDASETTTYRLRMYVSEEYNPQGDGGNLTYKARVNVYGLAGDKIESGEEEEPGVLAAGLYDENDNLLISWADLTSMEYQTITYLNDDSEEITGAILNIDSNGALTTCYGNGNNYSSEYLNGKLVLPEGVKEITRAFFHCVNLTSITIPSSVTTIGEFAFGSCTALRFVTLPNSITRFDQFSFFGLSDLTINYNGTEEQFYNINKSDAGAWNEESLEITVRCTDGDIIIPRYE